MREDPCPLYNVVEAAPQLVLLHLSHNTFLQLDQDIVFPSLKHTSPWLDSELRQAVLSKSIVCFDSLLQYASILR